MHDGGAALRPCLRAIFRTRSSAFSRGKRSIGSAASIGRIHRLRDPQSLRTYSDVWELITLVTILLPSLKFRIRRFRRRALMFVNGAVRIARASAHSNCSSGYPAELLAQRAPRFRTGTGCDWMNNWICRWPRFMMAEPSPLRPLRSLLFHPSRGD